MNKLPVTAVAALVIFALNVQSAIGGDLNNQLLEAVKKGDKNTVSLLLKQRIWYGF